MFEIWQQVVGLRPDCLKSFFYPAKLWDSQRIYWLNYSNIYLELVQFERVFTMTMELL